MRYIGSKREAYEDASVHGEVLLERTRSFAVLGRDYK